jgi:hypothetical protein
VEFVAMTGIRTRVVLLLLLIFGVGILARTVCVVAQPSEDDATLVREAFHRIAVVYASGGEAPDLVAKLNFALDLIQDARLKRMTGDEQGASLRETQARKVIIDVMNAAPAAQERAQHEATNRAWTVLASVPVTIAVSVFLFYLALKTWRWYEKTRLLEMRIVEKKS